MHRNPVVPIIERFEGGARTRSYPECMGGSEGDEEYVQHEGRSETTIVLLGVIRYPLPASSRYTDFEKREDTKQKGYRGFQIVCPSPDGFQFMHGKTTSH